MAFTPVQKLSIGTGAALSLVALVGLVSYLSITQMIGGERAVAAANANIARIDRVGARTVDAENAQRGFVSTGDTLYLPAIELAQSDVEFALDSLRTATEDHPSQRQNLDRVSQLVATRFRELRMAVSVRQRSGLDSAAKVLKAERAVRARDGVGPLLNRMRDEELVVLGERTRVMTDRGVAASNFILVGSFLALILAAIALQPLRPSVSRRLTQRLSQVMLPPLPELQLTMNEAARHAGDRLSRLQQVVAAMNGRVSASEVAGALLMRGAPPLVASLGFVAHGRGVALTILRSAGDAPYLAAGSPVPSNLMAPLIRAEQGLEPVVIESRAERHAEFPSLGRFSDNGTSDGAFAAVPLVADGAAHGVFVLAFADNRQFSDDERAYLATLGRLGGTAMSRATL